MSLVRWAKSLGIHAEVNPGGVTRRQRQLWAARIREPFASHSRQALATASQARHLAFSGTRRSGKTEWAGRESAALMLERDGYVVYVFVRTIDSFNRNWLARGLDGPSDKATGLIQILRDLGVPHKAPKGNKGQFTLVQFPWGSKLEVRPAGDMGRIADALGSTADLYWIDEAQHMTHLTSVLGDMVGPAGADFQARTWLTFTPGTEVGSLCERIAEGDLPAWTHIRTASWFNPRFGENFEARWQRAVLDQVGGVMQSVYQLTDAALQRLAGFSREEDLTLEALAKTPWISELPPQVQRHFLGLWVSDAGTLVFPGDHIPQSKRYWADWDDLVRPQAFGVLATVDSISHQTEVWQHRTEQLYTEHESDGPAWRLILGVDLGSHPDPFALFVGLYSPQQGALYELDSAKAYRLRGDEQFAALSAWIDAARELAEWHSVLFAGIVIDDDGGNTPAQVNEWRHKLVPLLPNTPIQGAYKPKRDMQLRLINTERSRYCIRLLRNSPADLEMRYLRRTQWDPAHPTRRVDIDKHRQVHVTVVHHHGLRDTIQVRPGNDVCDALRYAWYYATHMLGNVPVENIPASPTSDNDEQRWISHITSQIDALHQRH